MQSKLHDRIRRLEVLEPVSAGRLQVFGLRGDSGSRLSYLTLDESIAGGRIEVTEVSEGGSVPTLKVSNKGDTSVFLMAGEELLGAKQNRILNTSLMVGSRSEVPIPVSCVEAGRWRYSSRSFGSAGTTSHAALRAQVARQVNESYRRSRSPASDQGSVWREVSRKLSSMRSRSPSWALHQVYEDHRSRLEAAAEGLQPPEGCAGAAFAIGGRIAGVDVFDSPETLRKLWTKLLRAYVLDALEEEEEGRTLDRSRVADWLRLAAEAKAESFRSPGLGSDVRLEGEGLVGSGLLVDDEAVHVELFARA